MITITFQPIGPINSDGLVVRPNPSVLVLTLRKAEREWATKIAEALEPIYREGLEAGAWSEVTIHTT